jgi:hypothetical protein
LALGPDGQDYYLSVDYQSSAGDVFFTDIDACPAVAASATTAPVCPRTVLFPSYANGAATAMHFSGKGFSKPGWMVWSTYGTSASRDGTWPWFTNKIYAVELKANPRVYPIAYTRRAESAGGYWSEPHASVSRDFTRIAFNSNWGVNNANDIDTYIVHIPKSALPGGTTTPPPASPRRVTGGNQSPQVSSNGAVVNSSAPAAIVAPPAAADAPDLADPGRFIFISRGERLLARAARATVAAGNAVKAKRISLRAALWLLPGASLLIRSEDSLLIRSEE